MEASYSRPRLRALLLFTRGPWSFQSNRYSDLSNGGGTRKGTKKMRGEPRGKSKC